MPRNDTVATMLPRIGRVNSFWFKMLAVMLILSWVYVYRTSNVKCQNTETILVNRGEMQPLRSYDTGIKNMLLERSNHPAKETNKTIEIKFEEPPQTAALNLGEATAPKTPTKPQTILAYTNIYGNKFDITKYGRTKREVKIEPNPLSKCQYPCNWITNQTQINKADAVLFHLYNNLQNKDFIVDQLPRRANSKQKWIFMAREPQSFYYPEQLKHLDDMFNLTITFQRDSDVTIPYGSYWEYPDKSKSYYLNKPINYFNETGQKKLLAWIASNCVTSSRREKYVEELQKYVQVDIYGHCGNVTTNTKSANGFRQEIADQYHFYLAFENSDCDDYISEKFWNSLDIGIIPVVRGTRVNYKALAPHNSYIQSETFLTPQKLAEFLKEVASNKTLYNSFHQWRRHYFAKYKFFTVNTNWMCELCEQVHTSKPQTWKISEHFGEASRCFTYQTIRNRTGEHVENIFKH